MRGKGDEIISGHEESFYTSHIVYAEISSFFEGSDLPETERVLVTVRRLKRHWMKPRYPFLSPDGKVTDPLSFYTEKKAADALEMAEYLMGWVQRMLE